MYRDFADVAVVIPCYNCAETIRRAVESVSNQILRPAQVILVDDCSEDNTFSELCALQLEYQDGWVQVIQLDENQGVASARNRGWNHSKNRYVALLDADDSWHPHKIQIQYEWMNAHADAVMSGHICLHNNVQLVGIKNNSVDDFRIEKIKIFQLLVSNRFTTSTVMLRREMPFRFDQARRYGDDYLLWLQICLSGRGCYDLKLPLAHRYKLPYGEHGLSAKLWDMEKGQLATYRALFQDNQIGVVSYIGLVGFSIAKYIRRLSVVYSRKSKPTNEATSGYESIY